MVIFPRLLPLSAVWALAAVIFAAISIPAAAQQGPMPVTVAKPLIKKITEWDEYTGRFEATNRVEIRARVSGFLESIHFKDGDLVNKGDLLFVIDPRPFEAQLDVAKASLEAAKTRVNLAEREFKRAESLLKRNNISRETFDQRQAELATAQSTVLSAQAQIRIAKLNLEFTQVKAPISGRVSDARVDVGNLVEGGSAQSTLLSTLVSIDPILFTFSASEAEFLKYSRLDATGRRDSSRSAANPVFVRLMDEDSFTREGRMSFVDNELSPNTGTIRAQAVFENSSGFLVPGVFGRLRLIGSDEYEAVLIPDSAVVSDQSKKMVLIVDADGNVKAAPVDMGPLHEGLRVIHGGLGRDDRIVVKGIQRARPGGKVMAKEADLLPDGTIMVRTGS
ncbi:MAG TPA: efflux transporter periplasmic adaptor subunit [Rhodospirillaceae bacterium]|nr:efflux transporter periplasmic adaptor subunit [Magnetovibrio sp.]HBT43385.1 efflux transporter periplasmic adaptor subunit [Rhodospirillaceae bacterium]HCS70545.1 efflux transporter periplasmic adaptor subunit [Rhodospirillaceae bacterium]|tara:strand:+ start:759 stop:1934 length:1176 start_codon:yes stop_codon:yes gene_type:complete